MTLSNQLKMLVDLIVITILFLILLFLVNSANLNWGCLLLILYFFIFFLPVLLLHINYLKENKDDIFILKSNRIVRKSSLRTSEYSVEEIKGIVLFMNGSRGTVNGTLAFSSYYYAKIELLDGSSFVITSLCSTKINKILQNSFPSVKIKTEKIFYPMIDQ